MLNVLQKLPKNPNSDHFAFEIGYEKNNKQISEIFRVRHLGSRTKWFDSIKTLWFHFKKNEPMPKISKNTIAFVDDNIGLVQELKKSNHINKVSINDFHIDEVLGYGAFSSVFLVTHKETKQKYAMKVMDKNILIEQKHLHYIITEFEILKQVNNFPFILSLHYAFQTANYLYMVTDYCSQGDITKIKRIKNAKVLLAELILAFEFLHSKNIIYRDLKPENILLSEDGHIKLCDFNLAKENIDDNTRAMSFCGSPMYLSPEMLGQDGVKKSADIYGIGLIIYEIIVGKPAYYTTNPQLLYNNIASNNINFNHPRIETQEEKDLLKRILMLQPEMRLSISDMKRHPYFKEIDWDKVMKKELGCIEIEKKPEQRAKRIPERAHNITKPEIIKDDKREMKNCVRNFFYIRQNELNLNRMNSN